MNIGVHRLNELPPTYQQWQQIVYEADQLDALKWHHLSAFTESDYSQDWRGVLQYADKYRIDHRMYHYLTFKIEELNRARKNPVRYWPGDDVHKSIDDQLCCHTAHD